MPSSSTLFKVGATTAVALGAAVAYYYLTKMNSDQSSESTERKSEKTDFAVNQLPVIDLSAFFAKDVDPASYEAECKKVAYSLHHFGLVVLKDPRVSEADNDRFLSMMERYFALSDGIRDARPDAAYQVGVTGEKIEKARDHRQTMERIKGDNNKPQSPVNPVHDSKWRFFWRIGPRPPRTEFPVQNLEPVIPPEFPEWKTVMDGWGSKMSDALFTLAEMAATGFQMPPDTFTSRMLYGPHLLAPTGSDFNKYQEVGTVLAGFHYDLNFLTIHGKSRYPGLSVWNRDNQKTKVVVPDGCLLVQAGKQIEYLTGGHVLAGFHEVILTEETRNIIEQRRANGQSLWRVSSTLFGHIQSDQVLQPLAPFNTPQAAAAFPAVKAGDQVQRELEAISLARGR